MAKKVQKPSPTTERKPINISKIDPALWERFKQASDARGKRLWAYVEEALQDKLTKDGF